MSWKIDQLVLDRFAVSIGDLSNDGSQIGLTKLIQHLSGLMIARGRQRFLLTSNDHRSQANSPFIALWFPSTTPCEVSFDLQKLVYSVERV